MTTWNAQTSHISLAKDFQISRRMSHSVLTLCIEHKYFPILYVCL